MDYIQNYGFTKTVVQNNKYQQQNSEMKWIADYDGKEANIDVDVNENGHKENVHMKLNNDDLRQIFGITPVGIPLETRLANFNPYSTPQIITLERPIMKRKTHRRRRRRQRSRRSQRSSNRNSKNSRRRS